MESCGYHRIGDSRRRAGDQPKGEKVEARIEDRRFPEKGWRSTKRGESRGSERREESSGEGLEINQKVGE